MIAILNLKADELQHDFEDNDIIASVEVNDAVLKILKPKEHIYLCDYTNNKIVQLREEDLTLKEIGSDSSILKYYISKHFNEEITKFVVIK